MQKDQKPINNYDLTAVRKEYMFRPPKFISDYFETMIEDKRDMIMVYLTFNITVMGKKKLFYFYFVYAIIIIIHFNLKFIILLFYYFHVILNAFFFRPEIYQTKSAVLRIFQ